MSRPGWPTQAEAQAALDAFGFPPETMRLYEVIQVEDYWTYVTISQIDRRHKKYYRTKRLAKKALRRHPGWTDVEKKLMRFGSYEGSYGRWWWMP